MPAKNIHHDSVRQALIDEGWNITHDPLVLSYGGRDLFVDLGAESGAIAAEKDGRKIAVEIQSFVDASPVRDLENAVGQYVVYRSVLAEIEPGRVLYLAVPQRAFEGVLAERLGQLIVADSQLRLIVFDETSVRIVRWVP